MKKTKVKEIAIPQFLNVFKKTKNGKEVNSEGYNILSKPVSRAGRYKKSVILVSFFLNKKQKRKLDILLDSDIVKDVNKINLDSIYSNYFAALSRARIIRYDSISKMWERADNFLPYIEYIVECMNQSNVADKLHSLISNDQIQQLDTDPTSVVFEMLQDKVTVRTLRRIWRGTKDTVEDFILTADDEE